MAHRSLLAILLLFPSSSGYADEWPPPVLQSPAVSDSLPTPYPPPSEYYSPSLNPDHGREPGFFVGVDLAWMFPSFRGTRVASPAFRPIAPWRVPQLNAANLNSVDGAGSGSVGNVFGFQFSGGYRFQDGWGEFVTALRYVGGERQRLFANGDPFAFWFFQTKLPQDETAANDDQGSSSNVHNIEPGRPDPIGASLVRSTFEAITFDLGYANGLYLSRGIGVRFTLGGRWGSLSLDDLHEGPATYARETTRFIGAGPMSALYGEWVLVGAEPSDDGAFGLFVQGNGSLLYGRTTQTDREAFLFPNPASFRYVQTRNSQAVTMYGFEIGLIGRSFSLPGSLALGYQVEQWRHVGHVGASRFDVTLHGVFVRLTFNY